MYDASIITEKTFSLCLGKNGGYMQMGGYDNQGSLEGNLTTWVPLKRDMDFKINLSGF